MVANELATVRGMYGRITSASLFRISGIAGSDPDSENNRNPQSDHIVADNFPAQNPTPIGALSVTCPPIPYPVHRLGQVQLRVDDNDACERNV
jgi:hypothetical protein